MRHYQQIHCVTREHCSCGTSVGLKYLRPQLFQSSLKMKRTNGRSVFTRSTCQAIDCSHFRLHPFSNRFLESVKQPKQLWKSKKSLLLINYSVSRYQNSSTRLFSINCLGVKKRTALRRSVSIIFTTQVNSWVWEMRVSSQWNWRTASIAGWLT
jgi:hypothetical protein